MKKIILSVRNLTVEFKTRDKINRVLNSVGFDIYENETIALIGGSGSGKSVLSRYITGILEENGRIVSGSMEPENIKTAVIFQDPYSSLDPLMRIGKQISTVVRLHDNCNKDEAKERALSLLSRVGIDNPGDRFDDYPHQFSGGMRQRIVIAMALSAHPDVLICDEVTTALDVTTQKLILSLINELKSEFGFSIIFITHDIAVGSMMADRIAVMKEGKLVEVGEKKEILTNPKNEYTKSLIESQISLNGDLNSNVDLNADSNIISRSEAYSKRGTQSEQSIEITKRVEMLSVKDLCVSYGRGRNKYQALKNISLSIKSGEIFSLVGQSGSGKSTLARTILGLNDIDSGEILFKGRKILKSDRRNIQMIFQDSSGALNERATIEQIVSEGLDNLKDYGNKEERQKKIEDILLNVGLSKDVLGMYPHELSGGQRQRVGFARTMIIQPEFVIADEPVSSLDAGIRSQIIELIRQFRDKNGTTFIFIAHDLSLVRAISDRIAIIKDGMLVEQGTPEEIFEHSKDDYTKNLISAIPEICRLI